MKSRNPRHSRGWIGKRPQWSLRRRILEFITSNPGCTFRDIEELPGARGDEAIMRGERVLYWTGLAAPAIDTIIDLVRQGAVELRGPDYPAYTRRRPGEARVRAIRLPALPVAGLDPVSADTREPYWFPVTLHVVDGWSKRADGQRPN